MNLGLDQKQNEQNPCSLTGMTPVELEKILVELNQPKFRAKQILEWIWQKNVTDFASMSNLPASLRALLEKQFCVNPLTYSKTSGVEDLSQKFLWKLTDKRYVESVLLSANSGEDGESADRLTLCVSSQVGCAFGCKFCASGLFGLTRNLTAGEIAGQVQLVQSLLNRKVNNLVFMGMGEPLSNFSEVTRAIEILTAPWGGGIGARHITVSTSGVVPKIRELADDSKQIRLAISLHGATDEVRSQIMPVNKKWPISELMQALEYWTERKKQMVTFEYILIDGINDSFDQAKILVRHAQRLHAKVNLIPYNTVEGLEWKRPSETRCRKFLQVLRDSKVTATLRIEKGHDIEAACGQLRLKKEQEEGILPEF